MISQFPVISQSGIRHVDCRGYLEVGQPLIQQFHFRGVGTRGAGEGGGGGGQPYDYVTAIDVPLWCCRQESGTSWELGNYLNQQEIGGPYD